MRAVDLQLQVRGLRSSLGAVRLLIFNDESGWLQPATDPACCSHTRHEIGIPAPRTWRGVVPNLPVYHPNGLPIEYGVSLFMILKISERWTRT